MKVLLLAFLWASSVEAAVWKVESGHTWNENWRKAYSDWVATKVEGDFFKALGAPFSGLKIDCADTHYALLAYFAREHGLPMSANGGRVDQSSDRWNHIKDSNARLVAFIKYMAAYLGTESLAHRDSYSPPLEEIRSGDLFMYKVGSKGNYTRHTYIIKNVNPDGTFDVLYSTQANAKRGGALYRKPQYVFKKAPINAGVDANKWGFRRFKMRDSLDESASLIESDEQYERAREMSSSQFFEWVQEELAVLKETPQMKLSRLMGGLCKSVQERIAAVEEGLGYRSQIENRCMDYREYDIYSTPSRDHGIKKDYSALATLVSKLEVSGRADQVRREDLMMSRHIETNEMDFVDRDNLLHFCPIKLDMKGRGTDLALFSQALFEGGVSFHPNDGKALRWGLLTDEKPTTCKIFYGYPE